MKRIDIIKTAALVSVINVAYAAVNLFIGITESSLWFMAAGIYYAVLCLTRLTTVLMSKRIKDKFISAYTGVMLMLTSLPLLLTVAMCYTRDVGNELHEIVMITMALYSFSKITLAIINLIKAKKQSTPTERALRNLSFADALVSIASLQRSMLVSFGDMAATDIRIFNTATGGGVCILIFLLGLGLLRKWGKANNVKN